jgi:hypothetical protein
MEFNKTIGGEMSINRKYQVLNTVIFVSIIMIAIISAGIVTNINRLSKDTEMAIEQSWREQSRRTLQSLKNELLTEINSERVDPMSDKDLQEWAKVYLSDVRNGGETSDGFMIEMGQEKFIWDGSPDCSVASADKARYIKDNPPFHTKPILAEKAYAQMRQGFDTTSGMNNYWMFDDSYELLEWINIPAPRRGFYGQDMTKYGIKNQNYRGILIQLGTQKDEIMKPYTAIFEAGKRTKQLIYLLCSGVLIISIMFLFFLIYVQDTCKCARRESDAGGDTR